MLLSNSIQTSKAKQTQTKPSEPNHSTPSIESIRLGRVTQLPNPWTGQSIMIALPRLNLAQEFIFISAVSKQSTPCRSYNGSRYMAKTKELSFSVIKHNQLQVSNRMIRRSYSNLLQTFNDTQWRISLTIF